jgi:hypothetical protein
MNIPSKLAKVIDTARHRVGNAFSNLPEVFVSPAVAKERRYAMQASQELLALFNSMRAERPDAESRALYLQLIGKRTGKSEAEAKIALRQAEDSFAAWPVERAVNLRDVASFLIISESLVPLGQGVGTRSDMAEIVQTVIPENL